MRYESAVVDYDRRLCCRWLHNTTVAQNARECRVLESNTMIIFFSLFSSIASHHEKLVCGRAFRIRPRVCADGVESPDALTSSHQQVARITNKQVMSQSPKDSLYIVALAPERRWPDSLAMMSRLQQALSSNSAHDDASVISIERINRALKKKHPP